jgi:hypothetical protein
LFPSRVSGLTASVNPPVCTHRDQVGRVRSGAPARQRSRSTCWPAARSNAA